MTELQDKLQAAEAGSRELDLLVLEACDISPKEWPGDGVVGPEKVFILGGKKYSLPRVTTSIDAALALVKEVLPGWDIDIYFEADCGADAALYKGDPNRPGFKSTEQFTHRVPAIALCLALLATDTGGGGDEH
jgi:hypothetical protein